MRPRQNDCTSPRDSELAAESVLPVDPRMHFQGAHRLTSRLGRNVVPLLWLRRRIDAPLIDERVATRGRVAMEGGDEPADVKGKSPPSPREPQRSAGERRDQGAAPSQCTRPTSSPATTRRSSANALQRACVAQRKVAVRTPV
jgi:hypothetical protein